MNNARNRDDWLSAHHVSDILKEFIGHRGSQLREPREVPRSHADFIRVKWIVDAPHLTECSVRTQQRLDLRRLKDDSTQREAIHAAVHAYWFMIRKTRAR